MCAQQTCQARASVCAPCKQQLAGKKESARLLWQCSLTLTPLQDWKRCPANRPPTPSTGMHACAHSTSSRRNVICTLKPLQANLHLYTLPTLALVISNNQSDTSTSQSFYSLSFKLKSSLWVSVQRIKPTPLVAMHVCMSIGRQVLYVSVHPQSAPTDEVSSTKGGQRGEGLSGALTCPLAHPC